MPSPISLSSSLPSSSFSSLPIILLLLSNLTFTHTHPSPSPSPQTQPILPTCPSLPQPPGPPLPPPTPGYELRLILLAAGGFQTYDCDNEAPATTPPVWTGFTPTPLYDITATILSSSSSSSPEPFTSPAILARPPPSTRRYGLVQYLASTTESWLTRDPFTVIFHGISAPRDEDGNTPASASGQGRTSTTTTTTPSPLRGAVDWAKLSYDGDAEGAREVYRVHTVGGKTARTCGGGNARAEAQAQAQAQGWKERYVAQYWVFTPAEEGTQTQGMSAREVARRGLLPRVCRTLERIGEGRSTGGGFFWDGWAGVGRAQ
ncbi:MAG: hypothetical protein M1816_006870 [Peltula sp. TS41687]|nr:MAG: hypothetical protein M1816_006870 [Peltula sp. TS41687]